MLTCQKEKFLLDGKVTYLNCAYMGPLMKSVVEAGNKGIMAKANPNHVSPNDFFAPAEQLREQFALMIGSNDPNRIALIPSVSYGMATVARNMSISKGQEIIVVEGQFPSNIYAWQRLANDNNARVITINPPDTWKRRGEKWNQDILKAIGSKTAMVAIGQVHWADGTLFDLGTIGRKCRDNGALMVIDGSQSVGAYPFDVKKIQPDAVVCAGYKWLLGPYAFAIAWYGKSFDNGIPIEENWITRKDSHRFENLVNYTDEYREGAWRYNVGELSNFILLPMLLESVRQINEWGVEQIQQYCRAITEKPLEQIANAGYFIEDSSFRGSHLFGIGLKDPGQLETIKKKLSDAGIFVSQRGDFIRVSPYLYNIESDLELLADTLTS